MPSEPLKPWEPFATVVSPELGGAAPSAPTVDAHMIHGLERCIAAAHRLLDEHHDATVVDRQDAEDAERLLAVLRGGATAPTPDASIRADERERCAKVCEARAATMPPESLARNEAEKCARAIRIKDTPCVIAEAAARLRRDTGASHE
jgi:hypothetical protein